MNFKNLYHLCILKMVFVLSLNLLIDSAEGKSQTIILHSRSKLAKKSKDTAYFYRAFGLKTNLISLISFGLEFPVVKRTSIEMFWRSGAINMPYESKYLSKSNARVNLKYHIPDGDNYKLGSTYFIVGGLNFKTKYTETYDGRGVYTINSYAVDMGVLGFGLRNAKMEFWLAGETALRIRENTVSKTSDHYNYYSTQKDNWPLQFAVSGGIAIYCFQLKSLKQLKEKSHLKLK